MIKNASSKLAAVKSTKKDEGNEVPSRVTITKAPPFTLPDRTGNSVSLSDFKEKLIVLYFYPKDNTPGCTVEAIEFQGRTKDFAKRGAVVIGISGGSNRSKAKFCKAHSLEFPLLTDADFAIAKAYESFGQKTFWGRKYQGIFRNTFVLNSRRQILKVFENVKPEGHADEVLSAIVKLSR